MDEDLAAGRLEALRSSVEQPAVLEAAAGQRDGACARGRAARVDRRGERRVEPRGEQPAIDAAAERVRELADRRAEIELDLGRDLELERVDVERRRGREGLELGRGLAVVARRGREAEQRG